MPALQGEKVASRAQILKKAAEYIQYMRRRNVSHQQDIDNLRKQNNQLEGQSEYLFRKIKFKLFLMFKCFFFFSKGPGKGKSNWKFCWGGGDVGR